MPKKHGIPGMSGIPGIPPEYLEWPWIPGCFYAVDGESQVVNITPLKILYIFINLNKYEHFATLENFIIARNIALLVTWEISFKQLQ